jgi:hypothetical protein
MVLNEFVSLENRKTTNQQQFTTKRNNYSPFCVLLTHKAMKGADIVALCRACDPHAIHATIAYPKMF